MSTPLLFFYEVKVVVEGWINTNPWYVIILTFLFTLPITLPALWLLYRRYLRSRSRKELESGLTLKQEKKVERERRKEIKRKKKGNNT